MRSIRRFVLLSALLVLPAVHGNEPACWEHVTRDDGVEVYRKEVPDSPLVAFKGVTEVEAPLEKVLWVLADNDHRTEWVDLCAESRVLEQVSPFESVIYQRYSLPWYLTDRDYVYRAKATRGADGTVTLVLSSCDHADAPETIGIRAQLIESSYVLTPLGADRTRIAVEIHTDPKGMVPDWLVNLVQKSWPVKTLQGIRKQVAQDHVGSYALPPSSGS